MDDTISLRVDKDLKRRMKMHDEINWSAVLRKAIIENLQKRERVDFEKRRKAIAMMDKLRKTGAFDGKRNSTEIIREWRNKRVR